MTVLLQPYEVSLGASSAWERPDLKRHVEETSEIALTDSQWESLARGADRASRSFLFNRPHDPASRKRIEELSVAASRFRIALAAVINAERGNATLDLTDAEEEIYAPLQAALAANGIEMEQLEALRAALSFASVVETAMRGASAEIRKGGKGKGREVTGYSIYLHACKSVWQAGANSEKGLSMTGGRGSGPLVRLAHAAEILLPQAMRRGTEAKVGDAALRLFGERGDNEKRAFVTGQT